MSGNSLLDRLDGLVSRFEEVGTLITDPAVIADMKRFVKLNKEYHDLEKIVTARDTYVKLLNGVEEAREILDNEQDPEMREMAKEELDACNARIPEAEEHIKLLLVPADPEDDKNAIVEIRGGTGGDEAALFAVCWRLIPDVCQILRIERLESGRLEFQRRSRRRVQGNHFHGKRREGVRHAEI